MSKLLDFDCKKLSEWQSLDDPPIGLLGIDEAGYGSAAGSMYVAGVQFIPYKSLPKDLVEVADSKTVTRDIRARLARAIRKRAAYHFVVEVPLVEIDSNNPYWLRYRYPPILEKVTEMPYKCGVVYDGDRKIDLPGFVSESLIKGDKQSLAIAAASILAKEAKDREMEDLDGQFPEYGFINHSGYLTKEHTSAIKKYGLTKHHRKRYCKKFI